MGTKKSDVKHLKCCKHSSTYKPDLIRSHPFKWINFPIFVGLWFILFCLIICPIVWSKVSAYYNENKSTLNWPHDWPYFFWSVALFIFCVILGVLIAIWKCMVPKKSKYDKIFLNPEYGDEKEILCIHCMAFHPPGGAKCPCAATDKNSCGKCGSVRESYNACCQKNKPKEDTLSKGPSFDVTLRKQQPELDELDRPKRTRSIDNKRNSLRSAKSRNSSSSSYVIISSAHDAGTKDLINRKIETSKITPQTKQVITDGKIKTNDVLLTKSNPVQSKDTSGSLKSKKPTNLKPVDVDLANRHGNVEFFGEKIPIGTNTPTRETVVNVHYAKTYRPSESESPSNVAPKSVSSMESMDKKNFSQFLHLVEINTPITPEETIMGDDDVDNPPMSPREIFFYDLIQAAEKCDNGNSPDSTHFGFYNKLEKRRPTSHILVTSDVKLDEKTDKPDIDKLKRYTINIEPSESPNKKQRVIVTDLESPKIRELTRAISLHTSTGDDDDEKQIVRDDTKTKTTVKILRTVKKSTPEADALNYPVFVERKSFAPSSNTSSLSEQNSTHELRSLTKESVSRFFISDMSSRPTKPARLSSSVEPNQNTEDSKDNDDDVFSN